MNIKLLRWCVFMKTNDYVKYVTKSVIQYIDKPRTEKKQTRNKKKADREPFAVKWFGILPYLFMFIRKRK